MWRRHRFTNAAAGPGPSGYGPEWTYLGGPGAVTKEQAFRFGQNGDRAGFERWAKAYADGRFFDVLNNEYQEGVRYEQADS